MRTAFPPVTATRSNEKSPDSRWPATRSVTPVPATRTYGPAGSETASVVPPTCTLAAVAESVQVGGTTLAVSLPAGPYVRVAGTGVTLRVAGQRLSGDFSFERVAVTGGN